MTHHPRKTRPDSSDRVPDAATVELLLAPQHLARLLRAHGWTDADIRRDLTAGGRAPGELLLDVLAKQPDSAALMDLLAHPAPLATPVVEVGPARGVAEDARPLTPAPRATKG